MKHHDPRYSNVEPLPNHRFLELEEKVQEGDMVWKLGSGPWAKLTKSQASCYPVVWSGLAPFCRKIKKEKLVLKLEEVCPKNFRFHDETVAFKIAEQSGFEDGREHKATNGIIIQSSVAPVFSNSKFWIRGCYSADNDAVIVTTKEKYNKICEAVKEILARENAPKILKRITFKYGTLKARKVVDVTDEEENFYHGINVDADNVNPFLFYKPDMFEVENVVKNS